MIAVASMSMWISNTASTLIMLTIASALIETISKKHQLEPKDNTVGTAMMLGIAYAASEMDANRHTLHNHPNPYHMAHIDTACF